MKIIFTLMFISSTLLAAPQTKERFYQDVATVFTEIDEHPIGEVSQLYLDNDQPIALAHGSMFRWNGQKWDSAQMSVPDPESAPAVPAQAGKMLMHDTHKNLMAAGCENGLWLFDRSTKQWHRALPHDERYSWALRNVKVVAFGSQGELYFGSPQGFGVRVDGSWQLYTVQEGLPYNRFTSIATGKEGMVWLGTENGAIRFEDEQFYFRASRRWLPHDHVTSICVTSDGTAWLGTQNGISRIQAIPMTLEEKAAYFIDQVESRHNRMGFVAQCHLEEQFDIETWIPAISDNDGTYTANYGAAQAFRYAVTKDPQAKRLADRSFKVCKWMTDITHESGFPARVIIPIDWPEPVNQQYGYEYNLRRKKTDPFWKEIEPRFVKSEDGKYLWKCDTSSDELAGHYFFYGIYYDLVAETAAESSAVKKVVTDVTDHLIRHEFKLVDHDGKPTRWANFSPEFFHSIQGWEQRGLNAMMMLSFLKTAYHITGIEKYQQVATMLREKEHYHVFALEGKSFFPPDNVVPWDNNIFLGCMYGLMNYETDPELLLMYRISMENAWLHISKQKNALWNVIYGALAQRFKEVYDTGVYHTDRVFPWAAHYAQLKADRYVKADPQMKDVLETLRRMPLDLIGYTMDNLHRLDIVLDPTPGQDPNIGWHVSGKALPIDERPHVRQDRDAFVLAGTEGNGYSEHEGTFYLLPYYMALYHNLLE
jgi:hypothetical protein